MTKNRKPTRPVRPVPAQLLAGIIGGGGGTTISGGSGDDTIKIKN